MGSRPSLPWITGSGRGGHAQKVAYGFGRGMAGGPTLHRCTLCAPDVHHAIGGAAYMQVTGFSVLYFDI